MSALSDKRILKLCKQHDMVLPFEDCQVRGGSKGKVISYVLSSYGYDARLADEFMLTRVRASHRSAAVLDPKDCSDAFFTDSSRDNDGCYVIPPNEMALSRTVEYFRMPDDVMAICLGKSTYARCGLIVNVTPLEPGWHGHVTLELSNTTPLPIKVYPLEGICQFVFFRGERPSVTYSDRGGKYQGQTGVTTARL